MQLCNTEEGTYHEFPLKEESAPFLSGEANIFGLKEGHKGEEKFGTVLHSCDVQVIGLHADLRCWPFI